VKRLKLTAYCNSRWSCETGETVNGQRVLEYGAWNSVYVPPPLSAVERSPTRNQEAPPEAFVSVLWRSEDGIAKYTTRAGRKMEAQLRSGTRTLTGIQLNVRSGDYRAQFTCGCGKKDHVSIGAWRHAASDAGCRECRVALKRTVMVQVPREGWRARAEREARELRLNPMQVGTPPAARDTRRIWAVHR
jgi:hypothetical protein